MEKLNQLIATCVLGGIMFEGQLGTQSYTVQDLVHSTNLKSIESMWKQVKGQLKAMDTDSLFKTSNTAKKNKLQLKVDVLEAVFNYKYEAEQAEKLKIKTKAEAVERLAVLKQLKTEKEFAALGRKSLSSLEKEIAEAEALVNHE